MKASVTLSWFIHAPDLGAFLSHEGKRAKSVKGRARARANPNIPTTGAIHCPEVAKSTSSSPTMGQVHENETMARVNAMRNIESTPPVAVALLSTLLAHDDGSDSSNQPISDMANTTSSRVNTMFSGALVAMALSFSGPKRAVNSSARAIYITMIAAP